MRMFDIPVQHVDLGYVEAYIGDYTENGVWKGDRKNWDRIEMDVVFQPAFRGDPTNAAAKVRAAFRRHGFNPFMSEMWQEPWIDLPAAGVRVTTTGNVAVGATSVGVQGTSRFSVTEGAHFTFGSDPKIYTLDRDLSGSGTMRFEKPAYRAVSSGATVNFRPNARIRFKPTGTIRTRYEYGQLVHLSAMFEEVLGP